MTVTDETQTVSVESETEGDSGKRGRTADRDFSKFNDHHSELAEYVNARSGLEPLTPNQIKAVLLLRTDFTNEPEQAQKREEAKRRREAEAKEFEGLSDEEIKVIKAARRAAENAAKMEARAQDALARARALREAHEASGEDLAAAVEGAQNGAETPKKRGIGRNK